MKFLIIDDEKEITIIVKDQLRSQFPDASFEIAFDGIDAVILITEEKYDLVITDHKMEKMNGVEFLKNMRNIDASKNKETPCIFLSGYIADVEKLITNDSRVLFEEKPFNSESFFNKVHELIENKSF